MPGQMPPGQPPPGQMPPAVSRRQDQVPGYGGQRMSNLCLQLEQRLVAETQGSNQGRELLPKIENDMRTIERNYRTAQIAAQPRRLLGPVPVLAHAAAHAALRPARRRGG